MKIRNTFLLAVLLLFVNEIQAKGASLNSLIEELAPIARLTNGIAIETELSADANKMNDVVAEFLRVGSRDDVAKLKELRVDEVAKELGELYATVEKVPELNVDMAALADTFKALEHMKQGSDVLGRNVTDPSVDLQADIASAKSFLPHHYTGLDNLENVAKELKFIKITNNSDNAANIIAAHLVPLRNNLEKMISAIGPLSNFGKSDSLIRLQALREKLSNFQNMANLSKLFTDNFDSLSSMGAKLTELKTGVSKLKTVIDKQKSFPNLPVSLEESSKAVKKLLTEPPALRMTVGLSGGVDDLKLMFEDLKSGKMKKLVSQGKDLKALEKSLQSLVNIHSKLESTVKIWSQVRLTKSLEDAKDLAGILTTMAESGLKTPDTTTLGESLDSIAKCVKDLNLPAKVPNFKTANELNSYVEKLGSQFGAVKKFLENQTSALDTLSTNIPPLISFVSSLTTDSVHALAKTAWHEIGNYSELDVTITSMINIHEEYQKIKDEDPFVTLRKKVDFEVITEVLGSLNETNVDVMLSCLQKTSYNSAELDSTLNFGKSVQMLKNKKKEVESVKSFMTDLEQVKTGLLDVHKLTVSAQKPPSRRRRAPNSNSLANLKNAPTIAADLGKGVQVLREFAKILENEASVQVAVNADDGLKKAISAIPGVQSVWTDENRKGMGKMVVDLKELDKFAGSVKMDNMTSLWQIFDEAQKTDGVVGVDAKVFNDPISTVLAASSDLKIKGVSGDFKNLGALNLDFAQHKINLKAASFTLQPLQQFFDDYFGNSKASGGAQASGQLALTNSPSLDMFMIGGIIGGLVLFGAVGTGGWLVLRHLMQQKRWKNRERYWLYEGVFLDHQDDDWFKAIEYGKVATTKRLISEGRCLDVYKKHPTDLEYYTPLHMAVRHCHPKVVELLIRAGADRSFVSSKANETAEQLMERLINEDKMDVFVKKKLLQIKPIFKKYEKKKFQPQVKKLLPLELFTVGLFQRNSNEDFPEIYSAFVRKYESSAFLDVDENNRAVTHVVFDTEPDGSLNLTELGRDSLAEAVEAICSKRILVRTAWLTECLKNRNNFYKDYEYRITTVKLKIKIYESVDTWQKWTNSRHIPSLLGVIVVVDVDESINKRVKGMVSALGATVIDHEIFGDENAKIEPPTKPYWFPDQQRYWYVCDMWKTESVDVKYAHHKKNMRILILEEFFEKLLGMFGPPDRKPDNGLKQGQKSATGSTQASTNSNVSQV